MPTWVSVTSSSGGGSAFGVRPLQAPRARTRPETRSALEARTRAEVMGMCSPELFDTARCARPALRGRVDYDLVVSSNDILVTPRLHSAFSTPVLWRTTDCHVDT